ncbi:MAG: NADH:flavin oxidoreductase, partial [Bacteroidales bacterium]
MIHKSLLFSPSAIGPVTLRNRTIRSAAFEGMCIENGPSEALYNYHTAVAAGGVGMTTVAYAAVTRSGLSFPTQLWMRPAIVPGLRQLTNG